MEILIAITTGTLFAAGVYLLLKARTFPVVLGLTLISYGTNVFLFASSGLVVNRAPIVSEPPPYADPLPQALILTAIVISFAMTAVILVMALRSYFENNGDDTTGLIFLKPPIGEKSLDQILQTTQEENKRLD